MGLPRFAFLPHEVLSSILSFSIILFVERGGSRSNMSLGDFFADLMNVDIKVARWRIVVTEAYGRLSLRIPAGWVAPAPPLPETNGILHCKSKVVSTFSSLLYLCQQRYPWDIFVGQTQLKGNSSVILPVNCKDASDLSYETLGVIERWSFLIEIAASESENTIVFSHDNERPVPSLYVLTRDKNCWNAREHVVDVDVERIKVLQTSDQIALITCVVNGGLYAMHLSDGKSRNLSVELAHQGRFRWATNPVVMKCANNQANIVVFGHKTLTVWTLKTDKKLPIAKVEWIEHRCPREKTWPRLDARLDWNFTNVLLYQSDFVCLWHGVKLLSTNGPITCCSKGFFKSKHSNGSHIAGAKILNDTLVAIFRFKSVLYLELYRTAGLGIVWRMPLRLDSVLNSFPLNVTITSCGIFAASSVHCRDGIIIPWQHTRFCAHLACLKMITKSIDYSAVKCAGLPWLLWRFNDLLDAELELWTHARLMQMLYSMKADARNALVREINDIFIVQPPDAIFSLKARYCSTWPTLNEYAIVFVAMWAAHQATV
jgi:hypothetical protein